jgi:hypothetical protein
MPLDPTKQKEALINNITGAIDVMIRDAVELRIASMHTKDREVLDELEDRVAEGKRLLRASLERLLL